MTKSETQLTLQLRREIAETIAKHDILELPEAIEALFTQALTSLRQLNLLLNEARIDELKLTGLKRHDLMADGQRVADRLKALNKERE